MLCTATTIAVKMIRHFCFGRCTRIIFAHCICIVRTLRYTHGSGALGIVSTLPNTWYVLLLLLPSSPYSSMHTHHSRQEGVVVQLWRILYWHVICILYYRKEKYCQPSMTFRRSCLISIVVSTPHCGCGNPSSILGLDMDFFFFARHAA